MLKTTTRVAGNIVKYSREDLLDLALSPLSRKEPKNLERIMLCSIAKKV
jgi:hypothetical protein